MGRIEEEIAENFHGKRKDVYAGEICTLYFNDRMGGTPGMRLLKGKGRSYERIRNDDRIGGKEQFVRFQGMNLLLILHWSHS